MKELNKFQQLIVKWFLPKGFGEAPPKQEVELIIKRPKKYDQHILQHVNAVTSKDTTIVDKAVHLGMALLASHVQRTKSEDDSAL
jgi:hypothetical protein